MQTKKTLPGSQTPRSPDLFQMEPLPEVLLGTEKTASKTGLHQPPRSQRLPWTETLKSQGGNETTCCRQVWTDTAVLQPPAHGVHPDLSPTMSTSALRTSGPQEPMCRPTGHDVRRLLPFIRHIPSAAGTVYKASCKLVHVKRFALGRVLNI